MDLVHQSLAVSCLQKAKNIEADMVTMSTFYLDSAQQQNKMFQKLDFPVKTLDKFGDYAAPITSQEGAIIMNTDLMKKHNLSAPTCPERSDQKGV